MGAVEEVALMVVEEGPDVAKVVVAPLEDRVGKEEAWVVVPGEGAPLRANTSPTSDRSAYTLIARRLAECNTAQRRRSAQLRLHTGAAQHNQPCIVPSHTVLS